MIYAWQRRGSSYFYQTLGQLCKGGHEIYNFMYPSPNDVTYQFGQDWPYSSGRDVNA